MLERKLDGDGAARTLSWHLTQWGALRAVDQLYREALCGDYLELQDWVAAVPAQIDPECRDLGEFFRPIGLVSGTYQGRHATGARRAMRPRTNGAEG